MLDVELFHALAEAKVILADRLTAYRERPPTPRSDRPAGSLREVSVEGATVAAETDQKPSPRVDR